MIKIEIEKEKMERASTLKKSFADIHQRITLVEKKMKEINEESSLLMEELTNLRKIEHDFIDDLLEKYGPGKLDPFELKWIKE